MTPGTSTPTFRPLDLFQHSVFTVGCLVVLAFNAWHVFIRARATALPLLRLFASLLAQVLLVAATAILAPLLWKVFWQTNGGKAAKKRAVGRGGAQARGLAASTVDDGRGVRAGGLRDANPGGGVASTAPSIATTPSGRLRFSRGPRCASPEADNKIAVPDGTGLSGTARCSCPPAAFHRLSPPP